MKVGFGSLEDFAGTLIFEGDVAESDDAVALGDVFVDAVVDHFPVRGESVEVLFDVVFATRRPGEFHGLGAFGERTELHVVRHRIQPMVDAAGFGVVPEPIGFF